jgi:hypothetical protein
MFLIIIDFFIAVPFTCSFMQAASLAMVLTADTKNQVHVQVLINFAHHRVYVPFIVSPLNQLQ